MEYYSAMKRNEFDSVIVRWINLEPIILSKVSQKEKNTYHILTQNLAVATGLEKVRFHSNLKERQCQRML